VWGEELAAQHFVEGGAVVLARNWRCREGELDLVVREADGTLVFCEVKTRSSVAFGEPAEAVGPVKARRLRVLACRWLAESRPDSTGDLRFDVVGILRGPGGRPELTHLRAAF
jgi:putative endonuclease